MKPKVMSGLSVVSNGLKKVVNGARHFTHDLRILLITASIFNAKSLTLIDHCISGKLFLPRQIIDLMPRVGLSTEAVLDQPSLM